jgi:hypothetical protein
MTLAAPPRWPPRGSKRCWHPPRIPTESYRAASSIPPLPCISEASGLPNDIYLPRPPYLTQMNPLGYPAARSKGPGQLLIPLIPGLNYGSNSSDIGGAPRS